MKKYFAAASAEQPYPYHHPAESCDVDVENFNLDLNSLDLP